MALLGVFTILLGMGVGFLPDKGSNKITSTVLGENNVATGYLSDDDFIFDIPDTSAGITDDEINAALYVAPTTSATPPTTTTAPTTATSNTTSVAPTTSTAPTTTSGPTMNTGGAPSGSAPVMNTTPTNATPSTMSGPSTTDTSRTITPSATTATVPPTAGEGMHTPSTMQTPPSSYTASNTEKQTSSAKRPIGNSTSVQKNTSSSVEEKKEMTEEEKLRAKRQEQLKADHEKRFEQNQISTYGTADPTVAEKQKQKSLLTELGSSLQLLDEEARQLGDDVADSFSNDIDSALVEIESREYAGIEVEDPKVKPFDKEERKKRIEVLRTHLEEKKKEIRATIKDGIEKGVREEDSLDSLNSVLQSSLDEIQLLLQNESGTVVDLSTGSREITRLIEQGNARIIEGREQLKTREGLNLYKDTDSDGVSDYDEMNIYYTDPWNAHTSGSSLTDGERILLGFDPLTADAILIPAESPKDLPESSESIFEVTAITLRKVSKNATSSLEMTLNVASSSTENASSTSSTADEESIVRDQPDTYEELSFTGKGLPNSFVTLYIFSTPIVVTVKADDEGVWHYSLDVELEDGEHELYVASVNNAGRIIAKSPAVPFIKTAEAVAFTPLLRPEIAPTDPLSIIKDNMLAVGVLLSVLFGFIAVLFMGIYRMATIKRRAERDIA